MLLVDQNGFMQSVALHHVAAPFVCDCCGHGVTRLRGFLAFCAQDQGCVAAIVEDLPRCLVSPENHRPYSDGLIEASAPPITGVSFDARVPTAPNGPDTWMVDERGSGGVFHCDRPARRAQCRPVRHTSTEHTARPATTFRPGRHARRYRAFAGKSATRLAAVNAPAPPAAPGLSRARRMANPTASRIG